MHINKALIDRALDVPPINDNAVMMYRRLISLIEEYNRMSRDKGLSTKKIPVYSNNINCALISQLTVSIIKDIDRVKNIKRKEKILTGVIFENKMFKEGIWIYTVGEDNTVSVKLNADAFSNTFTGDTVTLDYEEMPYEKLIDTEGNEYITNSYYNMFDDLPSSSFKSLTIDNWTNNNAADMRYMFYGCESLVTLTLGDKFDASSVTTVENMFGNCYNLTTLNIGSNFNTSSVMNMKNMFYGCESLITLTLGDKFDTSSVTTMWCMFSGCSKLTSLTLGSKFNTSRVTDMKYMFSGCSKLTSLTLGSNFNTSSVTTMEGMFSGCQSLTSLTLGSNFNISGVEDMINMLSNCTKLGSITLYKVASKILTVFPGGATTWYINGTQLTGTDWDTNWGDGPVTFTRTIST